MLKSPLKFLGFLNNFAKIPKSKPHNDRKSKGKLRKGRRPTNTTVGTADRPSTPMEREFEVDTSSVVSERRQHYSNQPASPLFMDQETAAGSPDIIDTTNTFPLHTQAHATSHLPSIFKVQSRDFAEGGKKPRVQAPISGDPNRSWTASIPSSHRNPSEGGNFTHESDGDHGGGQDRVDYGPDYFPKRLMAPGKVTPFNHVDPHHNDAQEQHEAENDHLKNASQQQSKKIYRPILTRAGPLEENENRASKHDNHSEKSKAAGHGDWAKDSFKPEVYYYIVPAGLDIIFQDEDGTEITRVGKTIKGTQNHSSHTHTKNIPIVVQDIFGNELFRSNGDQDSLKDPDLGMVDAMAEDNFDGQLPLSPNHTAWKTIIVDEKGNQIPLKYAERNVGGPLSQQDLQTKVL